MTTRWLCIFRPHRWVHIKGGIWQCWRCKTISAGRIPPYGDGSYEGCPQ